MQIRDDGAFPPQPQPVRQRHNAPLPQLAVRNPAEEDIVRLPLSVIALWRDELNPALETLRVRLNLPASPEDDDAPGD